MRRTQSKQSPSYYKHMKVTASPAPSWLQGDNLETQSPADDLQPASKLRFGGQMLWCGLQDPEILKKTIDTETLQSQSRRRWSAAVSTSTQVCPPSAGR